jgi:outer membrane protein assembly factor BamB
MGCGEVKVMTGRNGRPKTRRTRALTLAGSGAEIVLERRLMPSVNVLTYHNNNARTGANLNETVLTPSNVSPVTFGQLAQVPVDGQVYAQPLVKTNVAFPIGSKHDVVYVATEHDSVYAFDANTLAPLWHDSFINPAAGITPVSSAALDYTDLTPEVGITSTPVIDPATNTLFVVSEIQAATPRGLLYVHQLHALDLATGAEKLGGPVTVQAAVPGTGTGSYRGTAFLQSIWALQRAALLLTGGTVYVGFASHGDAGPFHGWLIGYNARTLRQTAAFNVTPNGAEGGIWMSGGGPAADASGQIFLATGNGTFRPRARGGDYGDSILKLVPAAVPRSLVVADYYTPWNQAALSANDLDLGSGGVMLLPDQPGGNPHLLVVGGKEGRIYLINRDNMGHFSANPRTQHTVEQLPGQVNWLFDTPAYYNNTIYYASYGTPGQPSLNQGEHLKAFSLVQGLINPAARVSPFTYGYPGASPSISANGATNGIVWTVSNAGAAFGNVPALRAADASDVSHVLYDSSLAGAGNQSTRAVKFAVPTIANGKVYVGSSNALTLYGLLPGARSSKPGPSA